MQMMSTERWERSAAIGAIVAVVLMGVAIALAYSVASGDAGYLNRDAAKGTVGAAGLVTVAAALFLPWIPAVRSALGRAEGDSGGLASVAAYSGFAWLILTLAATAVGSAFSATVIAENDFRGDKELALVMTTSAHWLSGMAVAGSVVMTAAVSMMVFRRDALPRWFAWLGMLAAVLQVIFIGIWPVSAAVTLSWMLIFAFLMQRR